MDLLLWYWVVDDHLLWHSSCRIWVVIARSCIKIFLLVPLFPFLSIFQPSRLSWSSVQVVHTEWLLYLEILTSGLMLIYKNITIKVMTYNFGSSLVVNFFPHLTAKRQKQALKCMPRYPPSSHAWAPLMSPLWNAWWVADKLTYLTQNPLLIHDITIKSDHSECLGNYKPLLRPQQMHKNAFTLLMSIFFTMSHFGLIMLVWHKSVQ